MKKEKNIFLTTIGETRNRLDLRKKPDVLAADYARLRVNALYGKVKELLPAFSQMNDDSLLYELLYSYYRIGNLRNQVNHAITDMASVEKESSIRRKDIRNDLDIAIGTYQSLCKSLRKNKENSRACDSDLRQNEKICPPTRTSSVGGLERRYS